MADIKPSIRLVKSDEEKKICAQILCNSEPWTILKISFSQVMNTLKDTINEIHVVLVKDEIVGLIIIQTKGAFSGYLKSIALKKKWRGRGLGKIMMDFFEQRVFSKGENAFLCVSSFNTKAKQFYLDLGYKIIGELTDYVVKGKDEILMRKRK